MTTEHYFVFSTNWEDGKRLCRACGVTYDQGNHLTVDNGLKPRTSYHCSSGETDGHSGLYTGSLDVPELRRPDDHHCMCGLPYIEEDTETWRVTFEAQTPLDPEWHEVSVVRSKHAAHQQRDGLLTLIEQGEPIRNVQLAQVRITEVPV